MAAAFSRTGRSWRPPTAVWAATAAFAALLLLWSVLTPLDAAPDERNHADVVLHLAAGGSYPAWDGRRLGKAAFGVAFTHRPDMANPFRPRYLTEASAPPRSSRPDYAASGGDAETTLPNQIPQHPPLYYELGALVVRAERALDPGRPWPLDREWSLLRLLSVALMAPLPLLAWAAARRLGLPERAAVVAAVVPLAVPQLTHIGSALSNDDLLTPLCGALAVLLAGVLRGDRRIRVALAVGVVSALALLTKAFAVALVPWIVLAYAVPVLRDRRTLRPGARAGAVALATTVVLGAPWWVVHYVREGALSPSTADRVYENANPPASFHPDALGYGWWFARRVTERFWGYFGYTDVLMPVAGIVLATLVVVVAVVALGLRRPRPGAPSPGRLELAAFGSLLVLLLALVLQHAWSLYASSGLRPFAQGRYLFAGLVPFAVLVGAGIERLAGRWSPPAVVVGALAMQALGVEAVRRAWWGEPGAGVGASLRAMLAWSAWPPAAVWAVLALVVASAGAALVTSARRGPTWG